MDFGQTNGLPVPNTLTAFGKRVTPDIANSFLLVAANVNIQAEITLFIRGDTNGDGTVDLSDAQATLNYLFLGGLPPPTPFPQPGKDPTPDSIACP